ncbi:hypothetical protein DRJ24_02960, partial [Candidatus Acetothermia bacterium]
PSGAAVTLDGAPFGTTPVEHGGIAPGTHTVHLTKAGYSDETRQVSITAGMTTSLNVPLTAIPSNQPPHAEFSFSPASPTVGDAVTFDASGSSDSDGSIISYSWDFGDGSTATGAVVTHTFTASVSYQVTLTVTDDDGASDSTTRTVTVKPSDDIGWVSPVSHDDPADNWDLEERVYDNDPRKTYARHSIPPGEWTSFLYLNAPAGGLTCDRIRFIMSDSNPVYNLLIMDVDAYRDGGWVDIFDGMAEERKWTEVVFDEGLVTRMRLRAKNTAGGQWAIYLWEVDFRDATIPTP